MTLNTLLAAEKIFPETDNRGHGGTAQCPPMLCARRLRFEHVNDSAGFLRVCNGGIALYRKKWREEKKISLCIHVRLAQ